MSTPKSARRPRTRAAAKPTVTVPDAEPVTGSSEPDIAALFANLESEILKLKDSPDRALALGKLLRSKEAAVRAAI